jgi:DNA-binding transcriptional LysR family regulator
VTPATKGVIGQVGSFGNLLVFIVDMHVVHDLDDVGKTTVDLRRLDLNLLLVFRAVHEAGHLTRAAERLGLSQPAMSHALRRLRDALEDPLFLRTPRGMQPTARGAELAPGVTAALQALEAALGRGATFDPATTEARLRIATTDYVEELLWPKLAARLRAKAPRLTLETVTLPERIPLKELEAGTFDLALGYFPGAPGSLVAQKLYEEGFLCVLRKGHPAAASGKLSIAAYAELPHLLVAPWGIARGGVDDRLDALKRPRRIAMTVAHFGAAPGVIETTDLITTLPARLVRRWTSRYAIVALPPPQVLAMPPVRIATLWHARLTNDPLSRWVREELAAVAAASETES